MNTTAPCNDAAGESLFGESLACEEARPAAFVPGALDAAVLHAQGLRTEGLLRALAAVEDGRVDDSDDHTPADLALHRIEAKLDLLTSLVATLAKSRGQDPTRALRWSACGAQLETDEPAEVGSTGHLRVQPADWLPEAILLPATVVAATAAESGDRWQLCLRFGPLSPQLEMALERHLFRVHRRAIAESRRPR